MPSARKQHAVARQHGDGDRITVPSMSVPASDTVIGVSSSPDAGVTTATGGSLSGVTLSVIVFGAASNKPPLSCTLKVKLA